MILDIEDNYTIIMECCTSNLLLILLAVYVVYALLSRLVRILAGSVGRYDQRYILVTGCDTGFGHEIAKRLDRLGCHVFAGCLTEKGETELKKTSTSQRLHTISLDVTSDKSVRAAFSYVKQHLPADKGLWGVLNNAGIMTTLGHMEWFTIDNYKEEAAVNLYGLIDVTMTFLPLVKKERGRVVNTASAAGRLSIPRCLPYNVSKYGVEAFTDGLRRSLRPYKCKAILIEPGGHATNITSPEMTKRNLQRTWNQVTADVKEEFGEDCYKQMAEDWIKLAKKATSNNISDVVDAYEHALLGRCPRARYVVGLDAWVCLIIQALPEWLGDWIVEKMGFGPPVPATLKK